MASFTKIPSNSLKSDATLHSRLNESHDPPSLTYHTQLLKSVHQESHELDLLTFSKTKENKQKKQFLLMNLYLHVEIIVM